MKIILLIFSFICFIIFMILFVGQCNFFLNSNISHNPSDEVLQQDEMKPSQNVDEHLLPSDIPSEKARSESESDTDIKSDTGTYQGQIDNDFIEITILGVPKENTTKVFMLSDELTNRIEDLQLSTGDIIKFQYFINEVEQNVIVEIEKQDGGSDDK